MNMIQNDNQNIDGVDQQPQSLTLIIISSLVIFYS